MGIRRAAKDMLYYSGFTIDQPGICRGKIITMLAEPGGVVEIALHGRDFKEIKP